MVYAENERKWLAGTAKPVPVFDWLLESTAIKIASQEEPKRAEKILQLNRNAAMVVVTQYDDAPDYFEIHGVCDTAKWVLDTPTADDGGGRDLPWFLYKAIADALKLPDGWKAKNPSGSTWDIALRNNS